MEFNKNLRVRLGKVWGIETRIFLGCKQQKSKIIYPRLNLSNLFTFLSLVAKIFFFPKMILDVTLYKKSVRKTQKLLCNDKSRNNQKTVKQINSQMIYLTLQEVSVGIGRPGESMIPEANCSFHVHGILSHHGQPQVVQTNPKLERNLINTQMTYLTLQEASAGIDL